MEKQEEFHYGPQKVVGRDLTPEELAYFRPRWMRKDLLSKFRRQLDEFIDSSEEKWDAQVSEPLDALSLFKSLYWRIQKRGLGDKTEIKIVGGKIVSICKL